MAKYLSGLFSVLLMLTWSASSAVAANGEALNAIVKIFATQSQPNYLQPWQNYQQSSATGSGFVIDGGRIITNAHIVANQTFLQVRKQGDPKKYIARLEVVGHECDLAILKVDAPDFYRGITPLKFSDFPELQDKVHVLGYPIGGDNISVTEGVVSRIEPVNYNHSGRLLLAAQIDAAINPGNSGGPVLKDGKVVGVAFQGLSQSQNIGYMIPPPVIRHFLTDVADGRYDGFPDISAGIMQMENPDLRQWAKMKPDDTGVMITFLSPIEKNKGLLQTNDVLTAIDGVRIANDATIPFRRDEVIHFSTLIWNKYIGDKCQLKIIRDGKKIEITYPLSQIERLVTTRDFDLLPSYYLVGGLLFVPLTTNYLNSWRNWWSNAPRRLTNYAAFGEITEKYNEVVVLSSILADETNEGYQDIRFQRVIKYNGIEIRNLKDLLTRMEAQRDGFAEFELDDYIKLVIDLKKYREATGRIMKRYRIPVDRSNDLKTVTP